MTTDAQRHRAEEAKRLLANELLAEALTNTRFNAMVDLADADVDDKTEILRLQAVVRVTGDIRDMLEAEILATGEKDGGVTA